MEEPGLTVAFYCRNPVLTAQKEKRDESYLHIHHILLLDMFYIKGKEFYKPGKVQ